MAQHYETNEAAKLPTLHVVEQYSVGKSMERNEDVYATAPDRLALSDGATDKNGFRHEGQTGGELAAQAVVTVCQTTDAYGRELVDAATEAVRTQYEKFNPQALTESAYRYNASLVDARIVADEETREPVLAITMVGDSGARITHRDDTKTLLYETKPVDTANAAQRAAYIREHPDDIEGGRNAIMENLRTQHRLQNVSTAQNPLGYGVIDGTPVPDEFIKVYRFPANQVKSIELFSDGYAAVPEATGLAAFEAELARQNELDPHRVGEHGYPAQTKTADDRTYLLANL